MRNQITAIMQMIRYLSKHSSILQRQVLKTFSEEIFKNAKTLFKQSSQNLSASSSQILKHQVLTQ